ncbi:MAG TPA: hypothetical protein VLH84_02090 [Patescibacteria group bacterium]|nr:hypothetical protein [Patescibacteria group bacterium]
MSKDLERHKQTSLELERRFLVGAAHIGALVAGAEGVLLIEQGYALNKKGHKYRLRTSIDLLAPGQPTTYSWGRKKRVDALGREETERLLEPEEFEERWPNTDGWRITKTRLLVPVGSHTYEVDLLGDDLVIAEVECASAEEADALAVAKWCGPEITGLKGWGSSGLALRPLQPSELAMAWGAYATQANVLPR